MSRLPVTGDRLPVTVLYGLNKCLRKLKITLRGRDPDPEDDILNLMNGKESLQGYMNMHRAYYKASVILEHMHIHINEQNLVYVMSRNFYGC